VTAGFDVVVVGCGAAGSTAAHSLARGGARVLAIDRAAFPRDKPCGGGLTWRALKRFPEVEAALRARLEADAATALCVVRDLL
jgi:flavin-dependent dehydrogenase